MGPQHARNQYKEDGHEKGCTGHAWKTKRRNTGPTSQAGQRRTELSRRTVTLDMRKKETTTLGTEGKMGRVPPVVSEASRTGNRELPLVTLRDKGKTPGREKADRQNCPHGVGDGKGPREGTGLVNGEEKRSL